ncbi:MAG: PQQ-dependent sugar dehydrogenase [Dehalococcoidia bacterium]|nr:PQQ-dependent sugar dehydrogenase [Dehalococcoidia bacterium]
MLRPHPARRLSRRKCSILSGRGSTKHRKQGLLSLALDPAFAKNSHIWLYYSAREPRRTVLSRFTDDRRRCHRTRIRAVALEVPQPDRNHNGGAIRFGPDGMLYLGIGDGGDAWDPHGNGQDPATLLATIIRIDVRQSRPGQPYTVPVDNPFVPRRQAIAPRSGLRHPQPLADEFRLRRPASSGWRCRAGISPKRLISSSPGATTGWSVMEAFQRLDYSLPRRPVYRAPIRLRPRYGLCHNRRHRLPPLCHPEPRRA